MNLLPNEHCIALSQTGALFNKLIQSNILQQEQSFQYVHEVYLFLKLIEDINLYVIFFSPQPGPPSQIFERGGQPPL